MKTNNGSADMTWMVAVVLLGIGTLISAAPITRMDIYDAADNHLLFVTFDYDGSGACTGRNVYASDSTFMYTTTVTTGAGKETSVDYEGNPLFVTTLESSGDGKGSFSTVDQFGLSQFGSSLKYQESAENTYAVTQDDKTLCSQIYEYNDDNELTRITVNDKNSDLAWYALITQKTSVRRKRVMAACRKIHVGAHGSSIILSFGLSSGGMTTCELLSPAGKKVLTLLSKRIESGNHRFVNRDVAVSNGMYIMKMTVDGKPVATRRVVVQK